jgi:hypothetical protein
MINPYSDFPHFSIYNIGSHPGSGYQGFIAIAWKPGMRADFRDIRFHDDVGRKIPYWIQTKTDGSTASIFIKLTSSNTIIVRWGNPAAVSESNIDTTMEFGDEFDGAALNSDKWTGTGTVSGGILTVNDANSIVSKTTYARGSYQIISRWQNTSTAANSGCCVGFGNADTTSCLTCIAFKDASWTTFRIVTNSGNNSTASGVNISPAAYHINKLYYAATSSLVVDSDTTRTLSTNVPSTALAVYIQALWADCSTAVDYIAVRKFNGTDPTFSYVTSGYQPPQITQIFGMSDSVTTISLSSIISGGGSQTASVISNTMLSSTIVGSGEATANITSTKIINSILSGGGNQTANLISLIQNSSVISATGSQTANVSQFLILSSVLTGVGDSTAQVIKIIHIGSSISAEGSQTANAIEYEYLSSIISGGGSQTANCDTGTPTTIVELSSVLEGGGSQSALAALLNTISSVCTASGEATATPLIHNYLSSVIEGEGQASAIAELHKMLSSAVEGTGSYTANPLVYKLVSSSIAGIGRQTANLTSIEIPMTILKRPLTMTLNASTRTLTITPKIRRIIFDVE